MTRKPLQLKRGKLARLQALGLAYGEPALAVDDPAKPKLLVGDKDGNPREVSGGGAQLFQSDVDPTVSDGKDGDSWFNKTSRALFGPKTSGSWGAGVVLGGGSAGGTSTVKGWPSWSMPYGKGAVQACAFGGRYVLVVGANASSTEGQVALVYDVGQNAWTRTGDLPVAEGCGVGLEMGLDGLIYRFGSTRVQQFNPATLVWADLCATPTAFGNNSGRLVQRLTTGAHVGKMFVLRGTKPYLFDPATATWDDGTTLAALPTSSNTDNQHIVRGLDGRIWRPGGTYDNALWVYDPVANSWTSKATMPSQTWGSNSALLPDGNLVLIGGYPNRQRLTRYSIAANTWDAGLDWLTSPREAHGIAQVTESLVAVVAGSQSYSTIELLGIFGN